MPNHQNVMIYCEIVEGQLAAITKELLGGARRLADELGEELVAVFIGDNVIEPAGEATAYGADRVYVVDIDNQRVQVFDSDGNYVTAFGELGTADGQFARPLAICVDPSGAVYVVDEALSRVQKFVPTSGE